MGFSTFPVSGTITAAPGTAYIPTWFTVAATLDASGAKISNAYVNDGSIPLSGPGGYGGNSVGVMAFGGQNFYPNQDAFAMTNAGSTSWAADLDAETDATFNFLARIKRSALSDPAAAYSTTLSVAFTSP